MSSWKLDVVHAPERSASSRAAWASRTLEPRMDKNQTDVQVGQVAIPASIDGRLDAVPYVLLGCFIVPGCKEAVSAAKKP